jgi:hypothetical protein
MTKRSASMGVGKSASRDGGNPPAHGVRRLRRADRDRPREFGIYESDGAPDEKEGRPKNEPLGYQACMMRGEMWPRRQETFPC